MSDPFVQCTFVQLFYDLVYPHVKRYFNLRGLSFHQPATVKNEGEKEKKSGVYK